MPKPGKDETKMEFSMPIQVGEIKADGDDWTVEGYISTFGNVDEGNDRIVAGAFKNTLKSGRKVRFLMAHDPRMVLGVPKDLREDNKGLFGSFKISKTQLGTDTRQLLLDGALDSFSIGYKAVEWKIVDEDIRELYELDLFESSLVPIPMNPKAVVTNVKNYMTLADRADYLGDELTQLLSDLRGLVDGIDKPLSETKRKELVELLEMFSGMDAVRTDLQSVLAAAPIPQLGASRRISYEIADRRRRLANILEQE